MLHLQGVVLKYRDNFTFTNSNAYKIWSIWSELKQAFSIYILSQFQNSHYFTAVVVKNLSFDLFPP
jgi:hypothetical protein